VFVVENNVAKMFEVKTGISDDTYIEIESGLKGNENVVNGPYRAISKELENGKTVSTAPAKKKASEESNQ